MLLTDEGQHLDSTVPDHMSDHVPTPWQNLGQQSQVKSCIRKI